MYTVCIYKHDHSLLFPRVAESLSTKSTNSYLQLPLGAPTLCSLAKPTGTESPPVSPEATSAKPDVPQARILMRGKPSFDSLQSYNVVSLISHPREIDPRIRKKEKLNLSACPSSWLHVPLICRALKALLAQGLGSCDTSSGKEQGMNLTETDLPTVLNRRSNIYGRYGLLPTAPGQGGCRTIRDG